ncbi:MAG: hypothetical protein ACYC3L_01210 [Gemmatimonadaceae bacterium]
MTAPQTPAPLPQEIEAALDEYRHAWIMHERNANLGASPEGRVKRASTRLRALIAALAEDAKRWQLVANSVESLRLRLAKETWPDEEDTTHPRRLRDALIGQVSDAVCYSQWERVKADLRLLLDTLDAAREATT